MVDTQKVFAWAVKAGFPVLESNNKKMDFIGSGDSIDITENLVKLASLMEKEITRKITRDIYSKAVKVCISHAVGEDTAYKAAIAIDNLSYGIVEETKKPVKATIIFDNIDENAPIAPPTPNPTLRWVGTYNEATVNVAAANITPDIVPNVRL